jgi:hypothetical protein
LISGSDASRARRSQSIALNRNALLLSFM